MPTPTTLTRRDLILQRAQLLPDADAALLRAVYNDGKTLAELARLAHRTRGSIRKRFVRLRDHVTSRVFERALRHRHRFKGKRRAVLTHCIIEGRTVKEVARQLRMGYYETRLHRDTILALLNTSELLTGGVS